MKFISAIILSMTLLVGCSTDFMKEAYVGEVNGRTIFFFKDIQRNGMQYYTPQFASVCRDMFGVSSPCRIKETAIKNIRPYK